MPGKLEEMKKIINAKREDIDARTEALKVEYSYWQNAQAQFNNLNAIEAVHPGVVDKCMKSLMSVVDLVNTIPEFASEPTTVTPPDELEDPPAGPNDMSYGVLQYRVNEILRAARGALSCKQIKYRMIRNHSNEDPRDRINPMMDKWVKKGRAIRRYSKRHGVLKFRLNDYYDVTPEVLATKPIRGQLVKWLRSRLPNQLPSSTTDLRAVTISGLMTAALAAGIKLGIDPGKRVTDTLEKMESSGEVVGVQYCGTRVFRTALLNPAGPTAPVTPRDATVVAEEADAAAVAAN